MWYKLLYCSVVMLFDITESSSEFCVYKDVDKKHAQCTNTFSNYSLHFIPPVVYFISSIDLTGQPLKQLPFNGFHNLTSQYNISTVILKSCQISHINQGAFLNLYSLTSLYLPYNDIHHIDSETFQYVKQIQYIDLKHNKIERLGAELFQNLSALRVVLLTNNLIHTVDTDTFKSTPALTHIDLSNNRLQYLNVSFKDDFHGMKDTLLHGNPWNCDCNLVDLHDFFIRWWDRNYTQIPQCDNPPTLHGTTWNKLSTEKLKCEVRMIEPSNEIRVGTVDVDITFSCMVHSAIKPDIQWWNGSTVVPSNHLAYSWYGFTHFLNYTFNVQQYHAGVYRCIAGDLFREPETNVTLFVDNGQNHAPIILEVLISDDVSVGNNRTITFACKVFSKPYPIISWLFQIERYEDKLPVTIATRTENNENVYWCNASVVWKDQYQAGIYTCEASNYLKTSQFTIPTNTTQRVFNPWKEEPIQNVEPISIPHSNSSLRLVVVSFVVVQMIFVVLLIAAIIIVIQICERKYQKMKSNSRNNEEIELKVKTPACLKRQASNASTKPLLREL